MQRDYKVPTDFQKFLYVGQVLQAEGIKVAMEAHRRKMPYCMGSLFWQINDCWPVASWSSTDYYHKWKAQQYFAKKAFRQVLVSPDLENGRVSIYLVNDAPTFKKVILNLKVMNFNGKVSFEKQLLIELKANSSGVYFADELKKIVSDGSYKNSLFSAKVFEENKVVAENILYFVPVKELLLPKTLVMKTVHEENGNFILELKAAKLVKNLYLSLEEGDGFFSDNYFDMLPGETIIVWFKPNSKMELSDFNKSLKLMQMSDI